MGKFSLMDTILGCFKSKSKKSDLDDALEAKQCSHTVAYHPHKDEAIIVIFNEGFTLTPVKTSHQFVDIQELDNAVTSTVVYTQSSSEPFEPEEIVTNAEVIDEALVQKSLKGKPPDNWLKKEGRAHGNEEDDNDYHGTSEGFSSVAHPISEIKSKKNPEKAKKVKNSKFFMCQKFKSPEITQYLSEEEEVHKPEVDNCYYCGSSEVFSSFDILNTDIIKKKNKKVEKSKKLLKFPKLKKAKKHKSLVKEEEKMSSSETDNDTEPSIGYDKPWDGLGIAVKKENVVEKHRDTGENKVENVVDDTIGALPKRKKSFKKKVVKIVTLSKVRKAIRGKTSKS